MFTYIDADIYLFAGLLKKVISMQGTLIPINVVLQTM